MGAFERLVLRHLEDREGWPFEARVAELLLEKNYLIDQPFYYEDMQTQKTREMDIIARKCIMLGPNIFARLIFVISVKRSRDPYLFFQNYTSSGAHDDIWCGYTTSRRIMRGPDGNDIVISKNNLKQDFDMVGIGFKDIFAGSACRITFVQKVMNIVKDPSRWMIIKKKETDLLSKEASALKFEQEGLRNENIDLLKAAEAWNNTKSDDESKEIERYTKTGACIIRLIVPVVVRNSPSLVYFRHNSKPFIAKVGRLYT